MARAIGLPAAFLFNVAVSRLLGAAGAGVFQFSVAVGLVAATFARFGVGMRLLRDTARALSEGRTQQVRRVYAGSVAVVALVGFAASALMMAAEPLFSPSAADGGMFTPVYRTIALSVVPLSLLVVNCRFLAGTGAAAGSTFFENAAVPTLALALVPFAAIGGDPRGAALVYTLAVTLACAFTFVFALSRLPGPSAATAAGWGSAARARAGFTTALNEGVLRARSSGYFFGNEILLVLLGTIDCVLLGLLVGSAEVGIFSAVLRLGIVATWFRLPVYTRVSPRMAALAKNGNHEQLAVVCVRAARLVTLGSLPVLGGLAVFPPLCLSLFGHEFVAGAAALTIVACGKFVEVAAGPTREVLLMGGRERDVAGCVAGTLVLQVLLGLVLIPRFGLVGAAVTNCTITVALAASSFGLVCKRFGFAPWCFGRVSRN